MREDVVGVAEWTAGVVARATRGPLSHSPHIGEPCPPLTTAQSHPTQVTPSRATTDLSKADPQGPAGFLTAQSWTTLLGGNEGSLAL